MTAKRQHRQIARIERRDATLADREGAGNARNAKRNRKKGNIILARQQSTEATWDHQWATKRRRIANKNAKKG